MTCVVGKKSGKNLWIQMIFPHSSKYKPTVTDANRLTITNHVFIFKKFMLFGNIFLTLMVKFYICIKKKVDQILNVLPFRLQGYNSWMKKVVKSEIKFGVPFMDIDSVYKIEMICLRGT